MIAFVAGVIAASTAAGSTQYVSSSMSTNTGVAPVRATELPVAANVNAGTMTSSPGPIPNEAIAMCKAAVPLLTDKQCFTPKYSSSSRCSAVACGALLPWKMFESNTALTASRSAWVIGGHDLTSPADTTGSPPKIANSRIVLILHSILGNYLRCTIKPGKTSNNYIVSVCRKFKLVAQ